MLFFVIDFEICKKNHLSYYGGNIMVYFTFAFVESRQRGAKDTRGTIKLLKSKIN